MPSVTITNVVKEPGGKIRVRFGKVEREYESLAHMRACVRAALTIEDLQDIALGIMLSRQPALGNPSVFEGRSCNVDFSVANWGTLS